MLNFAHLMKNQDVNSVIQVIRLIMAARNEDLECHLCRKDQIVVTVEEKRQTDFATPQ